MLLTEEEAGSVTMDIMGSAGSGGWGYGTAFGDEKEMYNIFVKPFVDVVQTTAGKAKEVSSSAQTAIHTAFRTIATTLIPFLNKDYADIFATEKKRIDKIRKEYAEVYKSNWDAFNYEDAVFASFLYDPVSFLTTRFIQKAPKAAMEILSVLSGGTLDDDLGKAKSLLGKEKDKRRERRKHEGVIKEDGEGESVLSRVAQAFSGKEVKAKLSQSQVVQKMQQVGQQMVRETLAEVFKHAKGVLSARSLADLQKITKKPIPGMDQLKQVPEAERAQAEEQLLKAVKESMKLFYVKSLEAQVKSAVDGGTPQNSGYVQDYMKVIGKIKAL